MSDALEDNRTKQKVAERPSERMRYRADYLPFDFLKLVLDKEGKEGLDIDRDDDIIKAMLVCLDGAVLRT